MEYLKLNCINVPSYEGKEPVNPMLVAFIYNKNVAIAAHTKYQAERRPADKELLDKIADGAELVAMELGKLLDFSYQQTHDAIQRSLAAIRRATAAGVPYRVPGSIYLNMPDGTRQVIDAGKEKNPC